MVYQRRVVKRRPASLTDAEWIALAERGKVSREHFMPRDGLATPPVDVPSMLYCVQLEGLRWRLEKLWMAMQRPKSELTGNGSSSAAVRPGQLLSPFCELWEFLTKTHYADGTKRLAGCISVKCLSSGLQVTLTDSTSATYCCLTGECLDDVFLALEIGLKDGSLPWRASSYSKVKR